MYFGREAMGSKNMPVYVMPKMREYLSSNGPWDQLVKLNNIAIKELSSQRKVDLGTISITPFLVPHRDEYSETVGFKIKGPRKTALFIPDINKWSEWNTDLVEEVQKVDYAFLDATFFDDMELPGRDMSKIPHPFVIETMETLEDLTYEQKSKVWFIHMNHTNPLLDGDSLESKLVFDKGFRVATQRLRLPL
jgi:pyrroloquinoline quinone biosynthesis protein B